MAPRRPRADGRGRLGRRLLAVAGVVVVLLVVASARLFVWPPTDRPAPVDAVVALAGNPAQHRAQYALALARRGLAPTVVISRGAGQIPCPHDPHLEIICFLPHPVDTRGEAEFVGRLAARRHWRRILVVPVRTQSTRARLLVERCTRATVLVAPVAEPTVDLPYAVAYEWGALAKALVWKRGC